MFTVDLPSVLTKAVRLANSLGYDVFVYKTLQTIWCCESESISALKTLEWAAELVRDDEVFTKITRDTASELAAAIEVEVTRLAKRDST